MASQECAELFGVTEETVLNFWNSNLQAAVGQERWLRNHRPVRTYLVTVLSHFCVTSVDRPLALSPSYEPEWDSFKQFADLSQIAEMMMQQMTAGRNPKWMESAGAHTLLYAGFFRDQHKHRHNIPFFSKIGRECYLMAAVGKEDRVRLLTIIANRFEEYLFYFSRLRKHLEDQKYTLRM